MIAGSVTIAEDGTEAKSGLAAAIYDAFMAGYETDNGIALSGAFSVQVAIKRNYAALATRFAQGQMAYFATTFFTPEQGFVVRLTNKTGAPSIKGTVLQVSLTTNEAFDLQQNQNDVIGICYEDGIADGSTCAVVVAGIADVMLADGVGATRYDWLGASPTNGRAYSTGAVPPPSHFNEVGHCLQTVAGGVSVLCRAAIHFL